MTEISTEKLVDTIIEGIQNRKGERIVTIDLRKIKEAPAEFMVIAEATATRRWLPSPMRWTTMCAPRRMSIP